MIKLGLITAFSVLIAAVALLQREVNDLRTKVASGDNAAAAAIAKFERDMAIQSVAARNIADAQDAARRAAIDQGLNGLPMGSFRQPLYWKDATPKDQ